MQTNSKQTRDVSELVKYVKDMFPEGCTYECEKCPLLDASYRTTEHAVCEMLLALTNLSDD